MINVWEDGGGGGGGGDPRLGTGVPGPELSLSGGMVRENV